MIGNNSFGSVRLFELSELSELESVVIGKKCMTAAEKWEDARDNKRTNGSFLIANCSKLQSIQIGDYSFCDYYSFELSSLPSLQSMNTGEACFSCAPIFSLASVID